MVKTEKSPKFCQKIPKKNPKNLPLSFAGQGVLADPLTMSSCCYTIMPSLKCLH